MSHFTGEPFQKHLIQSINSFLKRDQKSNRHSETFMYKSCKILRDV